MIVRFLLYFEAQEQNGAPSAFQAEQPERIL